VQLPRATSVFLLLVVVRVLARSRSLLPLHLKLSEAWSSGPARQWRALEAVEKVVTGDVPHACPAPLLPHLSDQARSRYAGPMSSSQLSPEEIRAAAEVDRELGTEYHDAVVESFLAKVEKEIDTRVDARLAASRPATMQRPDVATYARQRLALKHMAIGSGAAAIPLSVVALALHSPGRISTGGAIEIIVVVWILIAAIYAACALRLHPPQDGGE
jgi:hypothetical protein